MTLNDVINRIADELTTQYEKEFSGDLSVRTFNNTAHISPDPVSRDRALRREGYEAATEVVRQTLYKIISEEIRSQKLDFIL